MKLLNSLKAKRKERRRCHIRMTGWGSCFAFLMICGGAPSPLGALEYRYHAWQIDRRERNQNYNLKMGPVLFDVRGGVEVRYNDNITYAERQAVDDLIIEPSVSLAARWDFSELNAFTFSLGLAYEKYLENPELDSSSTFARVTPGSEIAFNLQAGDLTLTVFDAFAYRTDPTDAVAAGPEEALILNVSQYARFENQVGIRAYYPLNIADVFVELSRLDEVPDGAGFLFRENTEYLFRGTLRRALAANLIGGVSLTASDLDYKPDNRPDGRSYAIGMFSEWGVSEYVRVVGSLALITADFNAAGDSYDGLSAYLEIRHLLNSAYNHTLALSHAFNYGFASEGRETTMLSYTCNWTVFGDWEIRGGIAYEETEDTSGIFTEAFDRWSVRLGTQRRLGSRVTGRVGIDYSEKGSGMSGRSYERFMLSLSANYDF